MNKSVDSSLGLFCSIPYEVLIYEVFGFVELEDILRSVQYVNNLFFKMVRLSLKDTIFTEDVIVVKKWVEIYNQCKQHFERAKVRRNRYYNSAEELNCELYGTSFEYFNTNKAKYPLKDPRISLECLHRLVTSNFLDLERFGKVVLGYLLRCTKSFFHPLGRYRYFRDYNRFSRIFIGTIDMISNKMSTRVEREDLPLEDSLFNIYFNHLYLVSQEIGVHLCQRIMKTIMSKPDKFRIPNEIERMQILLPSSQFFFSNNQFALCEFIEFGRPIENAQEIFENYILQHNHDFLGKFVTAYLKLYQNEEYDIFPNQVYLTPRIVDDFYKKTIEIFGWGGLKLKKLETEPKLCFKKEEEKKKSRKKKKKKKTKPTFWSRNSHQKIVERMKQFIRGCGILEDGKRTPGRREIEKLDRLVSTISEYETLVHRIRYARYGFRWDRRDYDYDEAYKRILEEERRESDEREDIELPEELDPHRRGGKADTCPWFFSYSRGRRHSGRKSSQRKRILFLRKNVTGKRKKRWKKGRRRDLRTLSYKIER